MRARPIAEPTGCEAQAIAEELTEAGGEPHGRRARPKEREIGPDEASRALVGHVPKERDHPHEHDESARQARRGGVS